MKFFKHSFNFDGRVYELSTEWNSEDFIDGNGIALGIKVSRYDEKNPGKPDVFQASVGIAQDKNGVPVLRIAAGKDFSIDIPMDQLTDEKAAAAIEAIPGWALGGGDPITGCLLRSGISVAASQIIRCNNESASYKWYKDRLLEIARCLRRNLPNMAMNAAFRAAKCILSGGH